jgi:hypothetical protein
MKDARVRYRPAQLDAVSAFGVRAFCLADANLRGSEQAQRFVTNLPQMTRIADAPGPYIYGVYADGLKRLWPRS